MEVIFNQRPHILTKSFYNHVACAAVTEPFFIGSAGDAHMAVK